MKKVLKRSLLVMLIISMLLPFLTFNNELHVSAAATDTKTLSKSQNYTQELPNSRTRYIFDDNTGYSLTNSKIYNKSELPFDKNLTDISISSDSKCDFTTKSKNNSSEVPAVLVKNATSFNINVNFKDYSIDSALFSWETNERKENSIIKKEYSISNDTWGSIQKGNDKQTVLSGENNIETGEIGSGALIIQTSEDGENWKRLDNIENGKYKYQNGLYTTDVLKYYHGTTQKYYLDGNAIKKGVYVNISFLYEIKYDYIYYYTTQERYWYQHLLFGIPIGGTHTVEHTETKITYYNICENYLFYVVEDDVEVVTFNNLTTEDKNEIVKVEKPNSDNPEEYKKQAEQYNNYLSSLIDNITPTMFNGDMTTTGFNINITSNPYLKVQVLHNDMALYIPQFKYISKDKNKDQIYYQFKTPGRYDITISSLTKTKKLTLYIDTSDADTAYKRYFGDSINYKGQKYGNNFINYSPSNRYENKRIFDEYSEVPVFLKQLTLNLKDVGKNFLPLSGRIENKSTGETIAFNNSQIVLTENGEYEVLLTTNVKYYDAVILKNENVKMAGDVRVYKFKFKIVGNDNHINVNEQLLANGSFKDLSILSPSDYIPKFYGVTRNSANKGEIIVAFADKDSALKYAREFLYGMIEAHTDSYGVKYWLIPNIDNPFGGKVISYSGWKNAKTVNTIAKKMVSERYFDLTKINSYLTIEKSVEDFTEEGIKLTDLQCEPLGKSIIIWYSKEQREAAVVKNLKIDGTNILKFIASSKEATLSKDEKGVYSIINSGMHDYYFVKDVLGIDSNTITAIDSNGNRFNLNYNDGLYSQLTKNNCKEGIVQIIETNIYGYITANYNIYYIPENYMPGNISVLADEQLISISSDNIPQSKTFNKLTIKDISNCIDPYSFISITNKDVIDSTKYYEISEAINLEITESGNYEIALIDRFGNSILYSFTIAKN